MHQLVLLSLFNINYQVIHKYNFHVKIRKVKSLIILLIVSSLLGSVLLGRMHAFRDFPCIHLDKIHVFF